MNQTNKEIKENTTSPTSSQRAQDEAGVPGQGHERHGRRLAGVVTHVVQDGLARGRRAWRVEGEDVEDGLGCFPVSKDIKRRKSDSLYLFPYF